LSFGMEVIRKIAAIDHALASTWLDDHVGDSVLTTAGTPENFFGLCCGSDRFILRLQNYRVTTSGF
jgi:hypothetical protein